MIISASRRTDIPAFYSKWFLNRVREKQCLVPNPFNKNQVSRVSLAPEDVDAFVFWTRNPRPMLSRLDELDALGYSYYFLYTLIGYPKRIDPGCPPMESVLETFLDLASRVGPDRVIWRYDPIILAGAADVAFHENRFRKIAETLNGLTRRCVVSFARTYRKAKKRVDDAIPGGIPAPDFADPALRGLLHFMASIAREQGIRMYNCAGEQDLTEFGIGPGKCIDGELIARLSGKPIAIVKDSSQRAECGCTVSKDIGMYDTCLFGCSYCYATSSLSRARSNFLRHDPGSPSLI